MMMTIVPVIGGMAQHECAEWTGWAVAPPHAGDNSMGDIDSELATASRHVAEARRIVARQRARIVKLKALGSATPDQELTLEAFVSTLALMERHAQELADTAKRLELPYRTLS
jgi:hypothetical protein